MPKCPNKQKVSLAQKAARIQAAQERQQRAAEKQQRSDSFKKIVTVVVCIILVLALGIPTVALSVLSM